MGKTKRNIPICLSSIAKLTQKKGIGKIISVRMVVKRWQILGVLFVLLLGVVVISVSNSFVDSHNFPLPFSENKQSDLRGIWVQAKSIRTREEIDDVLRQVEEGKFNTIFAEVFVEGQTLFQSKIATKHVQVHPNFDPLLYLVNEAHRRNIEVHAWFVVGPVGHEEDSPVLKKHHEWKLFGPDGDTTNWINFTRPDVRQFIKDLVKEVLANYAIDGILFDYLRYPGPEWGFDPYSVDAFLKEYGFDLNELRRTDLPAYGVFEMNPLDEPISAQVLAKFSNGVPAVSLNQYGTGEVMLINWSAHKRTTAIGSEVLQRGILRMLENGGEIYLLHSESNFKEYGVRGFKRVFDWLHDLGWTPIEISEANVEGLSPESVLVLPAVYLISPDTATQIMDFAGRGGGIIFIDGPTLSIHLSEIQTIIGMRWRGQYLKEGLLMIAVRSHPLIPNSLREVDLKIYQTRDQQWKEFRRKHVNVLLKEIHQHVKANHPDVVISVTIPYDQEKAIDEVLQDWPDWLEGGYVDFIIPQAFVSEITELQSKFDAWLEIIDEYDRIIFGLSTHLVDDDSKMIKSLDQLLAEVRIVRASGSNGFVIFNLGTMSEEQLKALASYPFSYNEEIGGE